MLDSYYGFTHSPTFFRMGSESSKTTETVVADTVDRSNNLYKVFTILRIHGDTGALIAGSVATLLLLCVVYRGILWRRAKMGAGRREPQDGQRAVWADPGRVAQEGWAGPGRVVRRLPPAYAAHEEVCKECRDSGRERTQT